MKFSGVFVALVAAAVANAQTFVLNTPLGVQQCLPTLLTWSGGTPPYRLTIHPGGDVSAAALRDFGSTEGNNFRWIPDLAPGTSVFARLRDDSGTAVETAAFSIQPGNDSCMNGSTSGGGFSTASGGGGGGGGATTTGGGGGGAPTVTRTTAGGSETTGGSGGAQTTSSEEGAGVMNHASTGMVVAGAAAVAMAVLA